MYALASSPIWMKTGCYCCSATLFLSSLQRQLLYVLLLTNLLTNLVAFSRRAGLVVFFPTNNVRSSGFYLRLCVSKFEHWIGRVFNAAPY